MIFLDAESLSLSYKSLIKNPAGEANTKAKAKNRTTKSNKNNIAKGIKIIIVDFAILIFAYLLKPIISITVPQTNAKGNPNRGIHANTKGEDV